MDVHGIGNLVMTPAPGERRVRFVGDQLGFTLKRADGQPFPAGWQGRLRTNLGRGEVLRQEIIHAHTGKLELHQASWRDIPLQPQEGGWGISLALTEVGFFRAKAYAMDPKGGQHWLEGPDAGISVHPDSSRTANTIYCAFVRMFGQSRTAARTRDDKLDYIFAPLDNLGYTIIPPSGKLRDLIQVLPHIFDTLHCRILHLLPINPTPTTYAKFGRYGSPYACQDLLAIDPALVEFDKRTTGVDQFRELAYAVHLKGGRLFLDVVINHTGWGSTLQENHPEWFVRGPSGSFLSPGAWGVVWEDLTELHHGNPALWEYLADVFLEWCRRGVDGFRCDAGYKIPVPAWRYITSRVLQEFPDTIFLLEGLGGSWEATEALLTEGGMQWAYSELFQNYSGRAVAAYLDYSLTQSRQAGLYVHYSETHDNDRLAKKGRQWSLMRNRLCALASVSGAFGFTCGVEWLAAEKIEVHHSRGLAWDNPNPIVPELARLNQLLTNHPCFFDDATVTRLSELDSDVCALSRVSQEGNDSVLVLVNTDEEQPHQFALPEKLYLQLSKPQIDLLGQPLPPIKLKDPSELVFHLKAGEAFCLASTREPLGLSGDLYRHSRARAAWAITTVSRRFRVREISTYNWRWLADLVNASHREFLGAVPYLQADLVKGDLVEALEKAMNEEHYPPVVLWDLLARRRVTVVPCDHWLLIEDTGPFRAVLQCETGVPQHVPSVPVRSRHIACFAPGQPAGDAQLRLERYAETDQRVAAAVRFVSLPPTYRDRLQPEGRSPRGVALLTNGIGGMARLQVDLGQVESKYDCLLAANLHPSVPVDRHILAKRARVWVNADGFVTMLNEGNLLEFSAGPPAWWRFVASAGDGRAVEIHLTADMLDQRNVTVFRFHRPAERVPFGSEVPPECHVALTVRVDIEDRNFHTETHRNDGAEHHFSSHCRPLAQGPGFEFTPAPDRQLRVLSTAGRYHHEAEWRQHIAHPLEATRGQVDHGDAYSPGWFELPLRKGDSATLTLCGDQASPPEIELQEFSERREAALNRAESQAAVEPGDRFGRQLARALQAFVVRRGEGKTIIAGYPWFLDWGRDSLICARGLLAAGLVETVEQLLVTFGRFVERGTLPNSIHGEDASNRDTSDAPLWFGLVCQEMAAHRPAFYETRVDTRGRTVTDALREIALGYRDGTPNGIRMDPTSGLIWSPSHFTWMDTNHPPGTPRQGFPVEIQALWIALLEQLAGLGLTVEGESWASLAQRARESLQDLFWLEERGYLADCLLARPGQPANEGTVDNALRSNSLWPVSLGLLQGEPAQRCVAEAARYLVVPGALRSLAPLPVTPPLPIYGSDGRLLNVPQEPYWGRYEGEEDTRRKPAYHNGTAWVWTLPTFVEALAVAWNWQTTAVTAAKTYLGSMERLLAEGCIGQLPEIVDGDAPHWQRGCDAQAWSVTEAFRVWKRLQHPPGLPVEETQGP